MKDEIQFISRTYANRILDSAGETYEPRGLYLIADDVDGKTVWTAIDNTNGDALTEEFTARNAATRWLNGYASRNRFGDMLPDRR